MKNHTYNIDVTISLHHQNITQWEIEQRIKHTLQEMKVVNTFPNKVAITKIEEVDEQ